MARTGLAASLTVTVACAHSTDTREALAAREAVRDDPRVCKLLERWWHSASAYDDRDKNEALDQDEYERFYIRLLRLVDDGEDDAEDEAKLDTKEEKAAFAADFRSDAGEDGSITKDEFMASIFQLADTWTGSTEVIGWAYDRHT